MKKVLLSALVAGGMIVSLGACSSGDSGGESEGMTLEIWDMQQSSKDVAAAYAPIVEAFEADNPGAEVNVTTFPFGQYRDKVLLAMKGGTGPDVLALDQVWMAEFAAGGLVAPIDDHLAESDSISGDDFFQGAWASNSYEDQTWGVPLNADVWEQMYYNSDLFTEAGLDPDNPPATWDEWTEAAAALTKAPDQFGISLMGCKDEGTVVMSDSFLFSNGGSIVEDGSAAFDSEENSGALSQYQDLLEYSPSGTAGACEQDAVARFTSGTAAMLLAGSWQQDTMKDAAQFDWRIAVPPAPEGKSFVGALGGWNLAINAKSDNPDLAFEWIEYMSQADNQAAVNSLIPALQAAGEEFIMANRAQPEVVLETLNNGAPRPLSPVYPAISQAQQDAIQAIIGGESAENAVGTAHGEIADALSALD